MSVFANEEVHNKIDIYKDACTIRSKSYGGTPLIQDSRLTTWLMPETLDWRIVTASPIEGFWLALAMAEARKARVCSEVSCWYWLTLEITLENILL